jgi:DNA-binding NarL/FixJ family response regulator
MPFALFERLDNTASGNLQTSAKDSLSQVCQSSIPSCRKPNRGKGNQPQPQTGGDLMNQIAPRYLTILVLHPDPLLCAGLVTALRQRESFQTFVDAVGDLGSNRPGIDVVITDYDNAMHLVRNVGSLAGRRVLVLTTNGREADIRRAIESGVHGYILLGGPLDELIEGVATVANGLRYVSRSVAQRMADSLTRTSLTSREMQVLSLVVAGESNKAIAWDLHIEVGTVKSHMQAIMTKLGASSRTQAAGIATARGLVEPRAATSRSSVRARAGVFEARALLA